MDLFTSIAIKWKKSLEYVLERNISVIWRFLELNLPEKVKNEPTDEEVLEDLEDAQRASLKAQERARAAIEKEKK